VDGRSGLVWSDPFAIELDWLDGNGHLNMAYYHVMFDRTVDVALDLLGLGAAYRDAHGASIFNVETHVVYRREVHAHDLVRVSFQLLGRDDKRLHGFETMERLGDGELVATSESLFIHVELASRRAGPLPEAAAVRADAMIRAHRAAGEPQMAGRRIAPLSGR
jgi:acyl-CoA thioester hydrolase